MVELASLGEALPDKQVIGVLIEADSPQFHTEITKFLETNVQMHASGFMSCLMDAERRKSFLDGAGVQANAAPAAFVFLAFINALSVFPFVADFSLVHACTMVCRDPRERLRERLTLF
jgi:hypothetical protein